MGDFRAFHCASRVVLDRQDPYATAPIKACESQPVPKQFLTVKDGQVLPAPVPGYTAAALAPLALLSFLPAAAIFFVLSIAALVLSAILFQRLGVSDWRTFLVASSLMVFGVSVPFGELPPIALAGIALTAWGTRTSKSWCVGLGFALAMVEPQIGVAVGVMLLVLSRRFIVPVAVASIVLGAMSLAAIGVAGNVEYLRSVLPEHVYAELPSVLQFSLSWVLWAVHVPDATAVLAGRISYFVMLAVIAWIATTRYARERCAHAVLIAPALAVVGGPFLHLDHIALALPAALYACNLYARRSFVVVAGLIAMSLPLMFVFTRPSLTIVVPLIAALLTVPYTTARIVPLRVAAVTICVVAALAVLVVKTGTGAVMLTDIHPVSAALSQASWSHFVRHNFVMESWSMWLIKAPTWFGILVTAAASIFACLPSRDRRASV